MRPTPAQLKAACEPGTALRSDDFKPIAVRGFGDTRNSYPHCMAWFDDHLYVGTTRNVLHLVKIAPDQPGQALQRWPVHVPPGTSAANLEQQCQIWRYSPTSGCWEMAFQSPRIEGRGHQVWRDFGYRSMVVVKTASDRRPSLYVTTMSSSMAPGALILRSEDGIDFEPASEPGLGDRSISSFRALVPFQGRLYTSPAGSGRMWAFTDSPVVLGTHDPVTHEWWPASEPGFGDPNNLTVFEMAAFADCLYAGTANAREGFQVWKTRAEGKPPFRWKKVISHGAYRGPLNQAVMSMFEYDGGLYVGGGIRRGGYDREFDTGPAAAELIRLYPDDTWELVAGEPRITPDGRVEPLSGRGAGFDNPFAAYIWSMAEYDGCLYVGTFDSSIFLAYLDQANLRVDQRHNLRQVQVENVVQRIGGFDLWVSRDGVEFERVSANGFGSPYNYGVRTMLGTPDGLYVGVANPFAPEVAARTASGWSYAPNPDGGLQIWLGSATGRTAAGHDQNAPLTQSINSYYDQWMDHAWTREYFGHTDFANLGFWAPETRSASEACERLMEKILEYIPGSSGTILDVACGRGATTRHLAKHWRPESIVGINISAAQLEACKRNAPGCEFQLMSATDMQFDDATFDNIVCVEAAFHFDTREDFLQEAHRVLKPGGRLVLTDILLDARDENTGERPLYVGGISSVAEYRRTLAELGFDRVDIVDLTDEAWIASSVHMADFLFAKVMDDRLHAREFRRLIRNMVGRSPAVHKYVLVAGRRGRRDRDAEPYERTFPRRRVHRSAVEQAREAHRELSETFGSRAESHWAVSVLLRDESRIHAKLADLALHVSGDLRPSSASRDLRRFARGQRRLVEAAERELNAHRELALSAAAHQLWHASVAAQPLEPDGYAERNEWSAAREARGVLQAASAARAESNMTCIPPAARMHVGRGAVHGYGAIASNALAEAMPARTRSVLAHLRVGLAQLAQRRAKTERRMADLLDEQRAQRKALERAARALGIECSFRDSAEDLSQTCRQLAEDTATRIRSYQARADVLASLLAELDLEQES